MTELQKERDISEYCFVTERDKFDNNTSNKNKKTGKLF
jgi:hypothetical protein